MKKLVGLAAVLMLCSGTAFADGKHDADLKTVEINKSLFMIQGQGGNIGVFVGADGTFMIDDQFAPVTDDILKAIKAVGGSMPKFVFNTHYHFDHTGGNENLGKQGAIVVSHDNVRERLKKGAYLKAFDKKIEPMAAAGLPVITFAGEMNFYLNNDNIHVIHYPEAHTDGDSFIYFENANVVHTGDIFFNGFYPFIDVDHGGSLSGMIAAVDKILSLTDDETRIIPGHGPLADESQLMAYRQMLDTADTRLSKLKAEGKTLEQVLAAKPLADLDVTWGKGLFTTDKWISLIYDSL